jgi:hypothetical protein
MREAQKVTGTLINLLHSFFGVDDDSGLRPLSSSTPIFF